MCRGVSQVKKFLGQVDDLQQWFKDYRGALAAAPPLAALPDAVQTQIDDFNVRHSSGSEISTCSLNVVDF